MARNWPCVCWDLFDVLQRLNFLDQNFDSDPAFETKLGLELSEHSVEEYHVRCRVGLGEHDGINVATGFFDDRDDIVVTPLGGDVVDADASCFCAPVEVV